MQWENWLYQEGEKPCSRMSLWDSEGRCLLSDPQWLRIIQHSLFSRHCSYSLIFSLWLRYEENTTAIPILQVSRRRAQRGERPCPRSHGKAQLGVNSWQSSPGGTSGKEPPANEGGVKDEGLIPGLGRSPGEGHGNPLQYSCLENPMDRGAWRAADHRAAKSWTWLKQLNTHACSLM